MGYEGLYEVSNLGNVRSLDRASRRRDGSFYRWLTGAVKVQSVSKFGYYTVCLSKKGVVRVRPVHALVCDAFLGPCPKGKERMHIDGNCKNNNVLNFRFGTHRENMIDAKSCKLSNDDRKEIKALWQNGKPLSAIAGMFGISTSHTYVLATQKRRYPKRHRKAPVKTRKGVPCSFPKNYAGDRSVRIRPFADAAVSRRWLEEKNNG